MTRTGPNTAVRAEILDTKLVVLFLEVLCDAGRNSGCGHRGRSLQIQLGLMLAVQTQAPPLNVSVPQFPYPKWGYLLTSISGLLEGLKEIT